MKVVVTGAGGFIGKNLMSYLLRLDGIKVFTIGRKDRPEDYLQKLEDAAVVFHLAGVNRPENEKEFQEGNSKLTENLLNALAQTKTAPKFIFASSVQAVKDNPYGKSKRTAEEIIKGAIKKGIVEGIIYRLPGVFGKWCRPNYNSVVATFCYNIARGLPIDIRDPHYQFPLVYIDDVVHHFLSHLEEPVKPGELCWGEICTTFKVELGKLGEVIKGFPALRKNLKAPQVGNTFHKYLYSTYLSYLPEDKFSYPLELKVDQRGDLFEWIKSESFGQVFVSTTKPGITRGNHFHHTKTEKFLVIRGEAVVRFREIDGEEVIEYPVYGDNPTVVDIPVGYTHNITNTGKSELITLFWANEIFDQERTDTYSLEV
jgi:UDP-2-acetamido-2,6-beta-L-arabino-hexul-4-ose reductase